MVLDNRADSQEAGQGSLKTAPYLAKVVSFLDPTFQGGFEVSLLRDSGNQIADETQTYIVKYASPFYGTTAYEFMGKNVSHDDTQKSYGFWAMPPDVGVTGLVIFINGNAAAGYWIACVQDKFINHMIPAIGGSKNYKGDGYDQGEHPLPVSEHNRKANAMEKSLEIDKIARAVHPIAKVFQTQGLIRDEFRGTSTSTARRDVPNMVFGMSSPGPLDRNGKKSFIGNKQSAALMPVSRLGGTQFVMDDGDDRYFREKHASVAPPKYIKGGGNTAIPYNEHFRIRTRTGHQLLLSNSEDLIYIGNSSGSAWIELTSNGKIDIFSNDSISIRTKQDFNFRCDRDFNIDAGRNINLRAGGAMYTEVKTDSVIIIDGDQKVKIKGKLDSTVEKAVTSKVGADYNLNVVGSIAETSGGTNETNAGGNIVETAPIIHMNGPTAKTAAIAELPFLLKTHSLPDLSKPGAAQNASTLSTILRRVPTPEPYPQHENLDPAAYGADKTDRDIKNRFQEPAETETTDLEKPPTEWKKYKKPSDNPF